MNEILKLVGQERKEIGTGSSRALRRTGMIPAIIYGPNKQPMAIIIEEKEATKIYRRHGFTSTVVELEIDGKTLKVLPKAVELNPLTELVRHVDFVYLDSGNQKVDVPIVFEGRERSIGIKRGGFLNVIFRKVKLLCPTDSIPRNVVVDIANMGVGSSIRGSGLNLPAGCSLVAKNDFIVASITGRGGKDESADETKGAAAAAAKTA